MALSASEQQTLRRIETGLAADDPGLAAVFTCFSAHASRLRPKPDAVVPVTPVRTVTVLPSRPRRPRHRVRWGLLLLGAGGCAAGMATHDLWLLLIGFQLVAVLLLLVPLATTGSTRTAPRGQSAAGSRPARRQSSR